MEGVGTRTPGFTSFAVYTRAHLRSLAVGRRFSANAVSRCAPSCEFGLHKRVKTRLWPQVKVVNTFYGVPYALGTGPIPCAPAELGCRQAHLCLEAVGRRLEVPRPDLHREEYRACVRVQRFVCKGGVDEFRVLAFDIRGWESRVFIIPIKGWG